MNNNYNRRKPPVKEKKHKTNGEVRFPEVRVSGEIGQGQIMSSYEAFKLAEKHEKHPRKRQKTLFSKKFTLLIEIHSQ